MSESAIAIAERVRSGQTGAKDVVTTALARAREVDESTKLNVFLSRADEHANRGAAAIDGRSDAAATLPLLGVPVAVKDNIVVSGLPATCGSRILENYVSPYTATAIERLQASGAVVIGKTNLDEFAMGSSTDFSAFGPTRNPLDPALVPGGSSGGSAAAVAAGVVPIALGSETGGSVRQPAAFCGIVGVKPTYGRVSRYGLVAFASSLDQVAVFGRDVADAALGLQIISGRDDRDATSADVPVGDFVPKDRRSERSGSHSERNGSHSERSGSHSERNGSHSERNGSHSERSEEPAGPLTGMVIGRPKEYFPAELDARIAKLCQDAFERLRSLGAEIRDVSLPHTMYAIPVYYIVAPAEASSNLARFDGVRYGLRIEGDGLRGMYEATRSQGFGPEVTRRIVLGTYVLSAGYYDAYYRKAMQVRTLIADDFRKVFAGGVHALLTPTTPSTAFAIGSKSNDPYEMYLSDIFTVTANLAGIPAMSLPIGRVGGLPVGGQIMASHFDEARMFAIASALERSLGAEAHR